MGSVGRKRGLPRRGQRGKEERSLTVSVVLDKLLAQDFVLRDSRERLVFFFHFFLFYFFGIGYAVRSNNANDMHPQEFNLVQKQK